MTATAALEARDPAAQGGRAELDDDALYEEVNGRRIKTPEMTYYAGIIASDLFGELAIHLHQQDPSGAPAPGELAVQILFRVPLPEDANRKRRPDLAFVSFERWPIDRPMSPTDDAWDVVPDLAVEVTSPTDSADDQLEKVAEYFQAGVRLVWVVYPKVRCIHVYEAWNRIQVVTEADILDGGVVIPGFRFPLDRLFGLVESVSDGT
jgi:Uma2 family endonuclease